MFIGDLLTCWRISEMCEKTKQAKNIVGNQGAHEGVSGKSTAGQQSGNAGGLEIPSEGRGQTRCEAPLSRGTAKADDCGLDQQCRREALLRMGPSCSPKAETEERGSAWGKSHLPRAGVSLTSLISLYFLNVFN